MTNRRDFLRLALTGSLALSSSSILPLTDGSHTLSVPLGVQLYTIRKKAEAQLADVLRSLHDIGFQEVEPYWNLYSRPAKELKRLIEDHGLQVPSGHFDYAKIDTSFEYARDLGLQYMICPMLPRSVWNHPDDFKKAAAQFNKWGEKARGMSLKFGFHNHDYEFRPLGGSTGLEIIMKETDPALVAIEMDCYWVTQAGGDPVAMMRKYPSRIKMLHLKDRKKNFPPSYDMEKSSEHFTEVGSGSIDWKATIAEARKIGVQHFFVENDEPEVDPIESVRRSYNNLEHILG